METADIPRIFHRIWLGGGQMPESFVTYGETWRRLHPGWEMMLWTEENLPPLTNRREFEEGETPAAKANVLRYEILDRFGGVYIDTDFECRKNIEPLIGEDVQAFVGEMKNGQINNAIIGVPPGHTLTQELIRCLPGHALAYCGKPAAIRTGLQFLNAIVRNRYADIVTVLPFAVFYPYSPLERLLAVGNDNFGDATYAIHHWNST